MVKLKIPPATRILFKHLIQKLNIVGKEEIAVYQYFVLFLHSVNPLPNDKILNVTKLKAFADVKFIIAQVIIFLFNTIENIVGKGENDSFQYLLLFLQCFQKSTSSRSLKFGIVWESIKKGYLS